MMYELWCTASSNCVSSSDERTLGHLLVDNIRHYGTRWLDNFMVFALDADDDVHLCGSAEDFLAGKGLAPA